VEAAGVREWIWLGLNVVVGMPLALAALVVAREGVRSGVAVACGFRVFEIHCGAGRRVAERPLGPVDLVLRWMPLGGASIARSGVARRYRLARAAIALAPAVLQLAWLASRMASDARLFESLAQGPATLAVLDLANRFLLALHLLVPVQLSKGIRTDIRLLIDGLLGPAGSNRSARASFYARLARHRIERADVAGAEAALERGLVQLGPEPMLVACDRRLHETDLSSVIDQGDCADAWQRLIDAAESDRDDEYRTWSFPMRVQRAGLMAVPILVVAILLGLSHADRFANGFESRWLRESEGLATEGNALRCASLLERWTTWARRVDRLLPPEASRRSDRHLAFARLERCRGALAAAAGHRAEALLAANAARSELAPVMFSEPARWLENELRLTKLFRHAATVEADRHAHRKALLAITNAERRLETVRRQVGLWPEPAARDRAQETLAAERAELLKMRERVMAGLSAR